MNRIASVFTIAALVAGTQHALVRAQAPAATARPAFEVTTVKPNKSGEMRVSMRIIPGGAYEAFNVTLGAMIRMAYRLQDFQLVGAPGWVDQDRFDIVGKAAGRRAPRSAADDAVAARRALQSEGPRGDARVPDLRARRRQPREAGAKAHAVESGLRGGRPRSRHRADADADADAHTARHATGVRNDEQRWAFDGRRLSR